MTDACIAYNGGGKIFGGEERGISSYNITVSFGYNIRSVKRLEARLYTATNVAIDGFVSTLTYLY